LHHMWTCLKPKFSKNAYRLIKRISLIRGYLRYVNSSHKIDEIESTIPSNTAADKKIRAKDVFTAPNKIANTKTTHPNNSITGDNNSKIKKNGTAKNPSRPYLGLKNISLCLYNVSASPLCHLFLCLDSTFTSSG